MMLMIVFSAISRYLFNNPIPNVINMVALLFFPAIGWLYLPIVQKNEDHISMDLVSNRLSETRSRLINILVYPFVAVLLLFSFEPLAAQTYDSFQNNVMSSGQIKIPMFIPRGIVALGVLLLAVTIVLQVVRWIHLSWTDFRGPQTDD